jgi:hypothetical protein
MPLQKGSLVSVCVEAVVLCATSEGIRRIERRDGAELRRPMGTTHPHVRAGAIAEELGLLATFLHSTSWRYEEGGIVLTYALLVDPPDDAALEVVRMVEVDAGEIAWAEATEPPDDIDTPSVVAHALRHLAWLVEADPIAGARLDGWRRYLGGHRPEPFHAFEPVAGCAPTAAGGGAE